MIVKRLRDLFIFICKKSRPKIVSPTEIKQSEYNIPFHVQEEIMKRLPVKSLVRFRSVSKAWKSLIDSRDFITAHTLLSHTQPQHLLLGYVCPKGKKKYACFVDDETLFQQRPVSNSRLFVKESRYTEIVGISHGLVCLYSSGTNLTCIWNPSSRKSIVVVVAFPYTPYPYLGQRFVGFWVCPLTYDPKIVAIRQYWNYLNMETYKQCEVMVYSLSSGNWRRLSTNLPTQPLRVSHRVVAAEGFIYWLGGFLGHYMIISFDVTNESFEVIDLPASLARHDGRGRALRIHKLRESLAILQYQESTCTVWMMEDGVQKSFTKLFTIHAPLFSLVGFMNSGVPILQVGSDGRIELVVYEPNSEHNIVFEVSGDPRHCTINSYTENLVLLGRSGCSSY